MRIWAEVYLANGAMVGMVNCISAGVTRRLDGAGEIELDVPVTDPAAVNHLGVGRIVHLYTDTPSKRLIAHGILLRQTLKISAEGERVQWRGMDLLEELRRANTLRGLHFQKPPFEQAKLVQVLHGRIFDVAVDVRHASPTFGRWHATSLTAEDVWELYVPRGFAHGFLTMEPNTLVAYKVDAPYAPVCEAGIRWNDGTLGIEWPVEEAQVILSARDRSLPTFRDLA